MEHYGTLVSQPPQGHKREALPAPDGHGAVFCLRGVWKVPSLESHPFLAFQIFGLKGLQFPAVKNHEIWDYKSMSA